MKKKLLLSSILSIVMCFSLICGATFALFTSEDKVNIAVTSGTVNVVAEIEDDVELYTFDVLQQNGKWATGGDAVVTDGNLTLNRIMPGDKAIANIKITNNSNVAIQYAMGFKVNGVLAKYLEVSTISNNVYTPVYEQSRWFMLEANGTIDTIKVAVELPEEVEEDEAMGASANIEFFISAVQGNAGPVTLPNGITEEGFAANNSKAAMIDSNGNPVYFATMKAALDEVHKAVELNGVSTMSATEKTSTGTIIYCKPYEDLGTANHLHVCQDLTIYGNGAYFSGGERDFEVDTYKEDCNGLTSDITLNFYNLGGAAVWGNRNTNYTININMQGCEDVSKIYVTGTVGTININMDDCSYDGANGYKNTAVYTNCPGTINISNTTFKGYAIAINQNNKSEGVQNINLTNCEFIDCATAQIAAAVNATSYAAPVRVIASKFETAVSNLNMTDCTFTYSEGNSAINGDILTYDFRKGEDNNGTVNAIVDGKAHFSFAGFLSTLEASNYNYDGKGATVAIRDIEYNHFNNTVRQFYIPKSTVNINSSVENLTIKNVIFTFIDNDTSNNFVAGELQTLAKNVKFEGCTFENMSVSPWETKTGANDCASATFTNCTWNNLSGRYGVHQSKAATLSITGCTFNNCQRGIHVNTVNNLTVTNNTFTGVDDGYGVLCLSEGITTELTFIDVSNNTAVDQTMLRQLSTVITYAQVTEIFNNNVYGKKYVNGSIEPASPWQAIDVVTTDVTRQYMVADNYVEICHVSGNLTLKNITFKNGITIYTNNVDNNGTVTLEDCTIYLNDGNLDPNNPSQTQAKADYGLNLNLVNGSDITFVFKNCTFTAADDHEYTGSNGYNVYIGGGYSANSITFEGCTFEKSGKHGIGCSAQGDSQYYALTVTGCNFKDWNNNSTFTNGAAIRGNLPAADFDANVTISGNTFGDNNGSTQKTVAIDSWTGSWN